MCHRLQRPHSALCEINMKRESWHGARTTNSFVEFRFPSFFHLRLLPSASTSRTTEKNISIVNGSYERISTAVRHRLCTLPIKRNHKFNDFLIFVILFFVFQISFRSCEMNARVQCSCSICSKLLLVVSCENIVFFFDFLFPRFILSWKARN